MSWFTFAGDSFAAASARTSLEYEMPQRFDRWQGRRGGDRLWLSLLVEAMEEAARPEVRSQPVEAAILAALRAQLAQSTARYPYSVSPSSLRH